MLITPKSWGDFQHYKDRSPPWIKLHKGLLDNFEYQCLPVASRALAPMLWLIASEHDRGEIDAAPKKLAFRLRMTEREVTDALKPLIDNGFFLVIDDDSDPLAERKRLADLEAEAEERKKRAEQKARDFEIFWAAYPKKEAKKDAETAWAKVDAPLETLLAVIAIKAKCDDWLKAKGQFVPLPATWLRARRWEDEVATGSVTVPGKPGRDPALVKLDEDAKRAAPIPLDQLERMAKVRMGAPA
jgi:DNA-binding MarR family transcriptional regulator